MPKTALCYFTGTGNSLYAAQVIAQWMRGCEIFSARELVRQPRLASEFESIGFFSPVYAMGVPHYIGRLAQALDPADFKGKYTFAVLTYGNVLGNAPSQLYRLFLDAGIQLSSVSSVVMPGNFTLIYQAPNEMAVERALIAADKKLGSIASSIAAGIVKEPAIDARFLNTFNEVFMPKSGERDDSFILTAACDGCGACVSYCPVANISLWEGRPLFHHRCEFCLGCFHRCPKGAINFGRRTIKKRRYVNPRAF